MRKGELKKDDAGASSAAVGEGVDPVLFARCNVLRDVEDQTRPTNMAIMRGDVNAIEQAVARGFDIKIAAGIARQDDGLLASFYRDMVIADLKNINGNRVPEHYSKELSDIPDNITTLELAAAFGQAKMVTYLLEHGAVLTNWAIAFSIANFWPEVAESLIAKGRRAKMGLGFYVIPRLMRNPPSYVDRDRYFHTLQLAFSRAWCEIDDFMGHLKQNIKEGRASAIQCEAYYTLTWCDESSLARRYKNRTPAEKAAAFLVAKTPQAVTNLQQKFLHVLNLNIVSYSDLVARFSDMKPNEIITEVIKRITAEERYSKKRLTFLENYLRVFVFNEDTTVVYANTTAVQQQQERPVGSVAVTSLATTTLGDAAPASASAQGALYFDRHAAPVSVTYPSPYPVAVAPAPVASSAVADESDAASGAAVVTTPSAENPAAPVIATSSTADALINLDDDKPVPVPASAVGHDAASDAGSLDLFGLREAATTNGASADAGKKAVGVPVLA